MATITEMRELAAAKLAALNAEKARNSTNKDNESESLDKKPAETTGAMELSMKNANSIRYFCKIAGHRFIFSDGTEAFFNYGRLDVGPKEFPNSYKQYQSELNAILGRQTTIFLPDVPPEVAPEVKQNARSEAEIAEAEQRLAGSNIKTAQEMGEGSSTGAPTDVNQSTVDPALREAMLGNLPDMDALMANTQSSVS